MVEEAKELDGSAIWCADKGPCEWPRWLSSQSNPALFQDSVLFWLVVARFVLDHCSRLPRVLVVVHVRQEARPAFICFGKQRSLVFDCWERLPVPVDG